MTTTALFIFTLTLVLFAAVSRTATNGRFTAPMAFAGLGLLCGPLLLGGIEPHIDNTTIDRVAELTLVIALFTDASRIDVRKLRGMRALPVRLLGVGLPLTMLLGTVLALWLFPGFGVCEAAVLAVILGPTDAALGEPVVTAGQVPLTVRQGLNVESGFNDGLGLPALLVVASLATVDGSGMRDGGEWVVYVLGQLLGGPLVGLAVGVAATRLLQANHARGRVSAEYGRLALFALPIVAFTGAELVHASGFLAAFACGAVIATGSDALRDSVQEFAGSCGKLLDAAVFFIVGAVLLPRFLPGAGWAHVLFAVLALTLLRMAPVALALIGTRMHAPTVLFLGWFGPRGMASVIYLLIVIEDYRLPHIDDIATTVAVTVLLSIVAHGMTAAPGARRYGAWAKALVARAAELEPVPDQRLPDRDDTPLGQERIDR